MLRERPCRKTGSCIWGRKESDERMICSLPRCAFEDVSGTSAEFKLDRLQGKVVRVYPKGQ